MKAASSSMKGVALSRRASEETDRASPGGSARLRLPPRRVWTAGRGRSTESSSTGAPASRRSHPASRAASPGPGSRSRSHTATSAGWRDGSGSDEGRPSAAAG